MTNKQDRHILQLAYSPLIEWTDRSNIRAITDINYCIILGVNHFSRQADKVLMHPATWRLATFSREWRAVLSSFPSTYEDYDIL